MHLVRVAFNLFVLHNVYAAESCRNTFPKATVHVCVYLCVCVSRTHDTPVLGCVCRYWPHSMSILHHTHACTFTQLPPFPQTAFQASELLVSLVEELQFAASPAPPDSQAPVHVFFTEAAHNGVLCDERRLHESPKRQTDREWDQRRASAFVQTLKINQAWTLRRSISGSVLGTSHRGAVTGPESVACLINVCLRRELTGVRQGQRLVYDKHFTTTLT